MNKVQLTMRCSKSRRSSKSAGEGKQIYFWNYLRLIFLLPFLINIAFSQTQQIDSLKRLLSHSKSDELSILLELCKRDPSMNADTALMYAKRALRISGERHDFENKIASGFYISECYNMKGRSDTSLILCNKGLKEIPDTDKFFPAYRNFMWNKIVSLTKLRKIKESINECYNLLGSAERNNDIPGQVIAYNCLGVNNNILENRAEALAWVKKAYALFENDTTGNSSFPQYNSVRGLVFINLSAMYFYHNLNDSGFFFLRKAYSLARETQNLKIESDCYTLEGQVYLESNKTDSAEYMLKKSLDIQKKIGSIQNILVGLDAMETFYGKQKKYTEAISCIREEQWYSNKYDEPLVFQAYRDLATYYKELENYTAYGETMDTLMMLKDSLYQKSKAEDLAKLEAQYEVSTKEAFIAKQKLELLHKNIWIVSSILVLLLLLASTFFIYRYIRRKQKTALETAEEKERKRIAADLHDNIGAYASAISDNIDDIENRKLIADSSSLQNLKNNAAEIISSLRDTIWAFNKDAVTLTGISDRLKIYIQKVQQSYPGIRISMDENISGEGKLSPAQALHTFRIVQEAIHNALRHSGADKITIHLSGNENLIDISIEDNGTGFDADAKTGTGNGLINMNTRAREAGYILSIAKAHPKGTAVQLTSGMPIKNNKK
ncbi:MAG TPA: ATP-binding protein [Chitinophagaceae bacterium]|nr:ATP-binding protein [Chitinophagaceae bacterium]